MKLIPKTAIVTAIALCSVYMADAQKIKITEGDFAALKGQTKLITEYEYDHVKVGNFDNEEDYIQKKKDDYNKKEPGRGDTWAAAWKNDRPSRFEPKFEELFSEHSGMQANKSVKKAKYTMIFKTTFVEPGFNVGVMRKNAYIDGEIWIVETEDHSKVVAKATVDNSPGRTFGGMDFDTGGRIAEAYAAAGKAVAKKVKKAID